MDCELSRTSNATRWNPKISIWRIRNCTASARRDFTCTSASCTSVASLINAAGVR